MWNDDRSDSATDSESEVDEAVDAGRAFIDLLLSLLTCGRLSAKNVCILCWWASKGGLAAARDLAFRPDAPSSHYQRHIDCVNKVALKSDINIYIDLLFKFYFLIQI